MKKNLLTTIAISCAIALGGMFTSCSRDDNPSSSDVKDPIAAKLIKEKTWVDTGNVKALNSIWAYTFNNDGTMMCSGLSKFGDPDQIITMDFFGKWKEIKNYKDPYSVVNSNVRCYAVELYMKDFSIDDEDVDISDAPVYKDTLLVQYKGNEMKLVMTSDIERYIGSQSKASTRSTASGLWSVVQAAIPADMITEDQLVETCIEIISNMSDEEIADVLSKLTDEDIEELLEIMEALTGMDCSEYISDDDEEENNDEE